MSIEIFDYHSIQPFKIFGLTGNFWTLHIDILLATWAAMTVLFLLIALGRYFLSKGFNPVAVACECIVNFFINLFKDSFPTFHYHYFAFICSLFFFTFFCCLIGLVPYLEEATKDLNTTFAIALTSFMYVHYQKIKVHGFVNFLKEFTQPFFVMAPIHVIGELSKLASMSFRLFGNILGGGVILAMSIAVIDHYKLAFLSFSVCVVCFSIVLSKGNLLERVPVLLSINNIFFSILFFVSWIQIFLGIFEGLIQSFVITMLTTTYLAIGVAHEQKCEQ